MVDYTSKLAEYDSKIKQVNIEIEDAESECAKAVEQDDSRLFDEMYYYRNRKLDELETLIQERDCIYQESLKQNTKKG